MILFPAVDIQDGKAVRLKQGRAHESTVFAEDPTDAAKAWEARGAQWLHVVDLDGALPRLLADGAAFIIYTDIERDGMQCGVNVAALEHLSRLSTVPVIAAGGVATLADVQKLYPLTRTTSLAGAVSGRALYEGTLNLEEANAWIAAQ